MGSETPQNRDTVGTTLEGKIHESFTVAADRLFQAGLMNTKERIALSGAIGDMLGQFRKKVKPEVYARKMTEIAHGHLLKAAVLKARAMQALQARILQNRTFTSGRSRDRAVEVAAKTVQSQPVEQLDAKARQALLKTLRGVKALKGAEGTRAGAEFKEITNKINPQGDLFKGAIDPLTVGGAIATGGISAWLTTKQIQTAKALEAEVRRSQIAKRSLIAALAGSTAGGVAAGWALGKKQPKKTEKTTVIQPIVFDSGSIKAADDAVGKGDDEDPGERHLRKLRKMTEPVAKALPPVYKTKKAKGWDVMVDAVIGDDQGPSAK